MTCLHGVVRVAAGGLVIAAGAGIASAGPPAPPAPSPPAPSASPAPSAPPAPSAAATPPDDKKAQARDHFDKGVELSGKGDVTGALAEFLESRRLFPTRSATYNAASCLRALDRGEEALAMYEAFLGEYPDAPPELKTDAQRAVVELRKLVGTVEIDEAEPGAAVVIDGQNRGDYPLLAPLRVGRGSHVIRVFKEGFEPFETRVDVAGGQTVHAVARLRAAAESGSLRVAEQSGVVLEILVDGNRVGKTPWEGRLAVGEHTILLLGEGDVGTQPASVLIRRNDNIPLVLVAEHLGAAVRVEPTPVHASVAVDLVAVGHGLWNGRLRAGSHKIEVAAAGFLTEAREVSLEGGKPNVFTIVLQRDPSSPFWSKPPRQPRFIAELSVAAAITATLSGEVAGACIAPCIRNAGVGGHGVVRGGYELGGGFGFGVMAGYLAVIQYIRGRDTAVTPVGLGPDIGIANDTLALRGALAGVWAGWTLGESIPVHLRFGAGGLFGSVLDSRTGQFAASDGTRYSVGALTQTQSASFLYLAPEVRVGIPLGRHAEVTAGLEVPVLVAMDQPRWDASHSFSAGNDGRQGTFESDTLSGSVILNFAPGIGARYDF
jgi:hypothetical protein